MTPAGDIVAVPERGSLMGNRGVLVDDDGQIVRRWQVRRWIACVTEFRGRWRPVMTPRRWTELFFLDEATALSAGHRPCAHCRHADYQRFRAAFGRAHDLEAPSADAMDRILHADRLDEQRRKRTYVERLDALPDGAMVELAGSAYLVRNGALVYWTFSGYGFREPLQLDGATPLDVLTPRAIVATIRAGYEPETAPKVSAPAERGS